MRKSIQLIILGRMSTYFYVHQSTFFGNDSYIRHFYQCVKRFRDSGSYFKIVCIF